MRPARALAAIAAASCVLVAAHGAPPALAAWTDAEAARAAVRAGVVTQPVATSCAGVLLGNQVTFQWTHGSTGEVRTGYLAQVRTEAGALVDQAVLPATATSVSVTASQRLVVEVRAFAGSATGWTSTALSGLAVPGVLGLVAPTCQRWS